MRQTQRAAAGIQAFSGSVSSLRVWPGPVTTPDREPSVGERVSLFREPDVGNLLVRFDERGQETGPSQTGLRWRGESQVECPPGDYSYCACSRLYSATRLIRKSAAWKSAMARVLTWVSDRHLTGWACSACDWTFPLPSLLSDPEAKKAYDRLASAKFQRHDCATHQPVASLDPDSFIARAKGLVKRGFKPKDAADITAREIMFENHDDPDIARKVQIEAQGFLRRVKEGLI